jgi:hypothetical protein
MRRRILCFAITLALIFTTIPLLPMPAEASDLTWTEYGSVYDPPISSDKAYYPCVLYDADQFSGHGAAAYYKMWYSDGQGQYEAVTYSSNGINWSDPVQTTGIHPDGYHAKIIYIPGGYDAIGGTYYYKIWYWDNGANIYTIDALRTADSTNGENWQNDQVLTQDVTMPLVTSDPSNWSAGSYGPITIFYNLSGANTGSDPFNYRYSMYYDITTGGLEAIALGYSTDGNHWIRYGSAPVLPHGNPGDWDSNYACHGTVIKESDGTWRMWYSGGTDNCEAGIGYATSLDGLNWTKDPVNPIYSIGQGVAWRNERCYTPAVLYSSSNFDGHGEAATYKMWFTGMALADHNRTIGYAKVAPSPPVITASAGIGGSIDPGGSITISFGNNQTFNITPNPSYMINDVLVDGVSVGAISSYTFSNVTANHTIAVSFAEPRSLKDSVLGELTALRATVTDKKDGKKLDEAIGHLKKSLTPDWWIDDAHLQAKNGEQVFDEETDTVEELTNLIKDKKSSTNKALLQSFVVRLVEVDRLLAVVAIADAAAAGGDTKDIDKANEELGKGNIDVTNGKYESAIEHYQNAWEHALNATKVHDDDDD